ncbi:hypothetical protein MTO96_051385 [Rhipicephalus appendiculatus]
MSDKLTLDDSVGNNNASEAVAELTDVEIAAEVTATTVDNCFRHSGFCVANEGTACEPDERKTEVIPAGLRDALEDVSFDDYFDADRSAVVCGIITDDIITQSFTAQQKLKIIAVTEKFGNREAGRRHDVDESCV